MTTTTNNRATERQKALLRKLTLSSAFTSQEAEDTARWLTSRSATKQTASVLIDRALVRIREKNDRTKAAQARQEARRQAQEDARWEKTKETGQWTGTRATPQHGQIERPQRPTCPATGKELTFEDLKELLYH